MSPPAPPPEISIIQEDGDGGGEASDEPTGARRSLLPLSRTRSGETRRHSLFKSVSGSQVSLAAAGLRELTVVREGGVGGGDTRCLGGREGR